MLHVVVGSGGGPQLVAAAAHRAQGAVQVVLELRELVVDVDVALTAQAVGLGVGGVDEPGGFGVGGVDNLGLGHQPLLLLDEPSMGLAPLLIREIFSIIQDINKTGTTILLVEQNANMALSIANRAYVLETGRITLSRR